MESCMESKKQGRISIIMPVYNGVSWIGECIESIRQQTDTNWELLVLDDHSTDGTTERVFKLAEEDSRILPILRQKNGVSAARNEGLEKAQGEFIMFVDADDKLDPQMLSVLRAMLGQTESDLAVCDYYRWNGKPDGVYNRSEELLKTDVEREENAARAKKSAACRRHRKSRGRGRFSTTRSSCGGRPCIQSLRIRFGLSPARKYPLLERIIPPQCDWANPFPGRLEHR